jgi:hypothetical protein
VEFQCLEGKKAMNLDDVLMGIVVGGIGVAAAYLRAEYVRWREQGAAELRRESALRELHTARLFHHPTATLGAISGAAARRSAARSTPRTHPLVERRLRPRQHAAQ